LGNNQVKISQKVLGEGYFFDSPCMSVVVTDTTVVYSLRHELYTVTAVCKSTCVWHSSTLRWKNCYQL